MIRFDQASKIFPGGVQAVRELCLEVKKGETLVLLGSSGCGKTTTLKMINRLIEPTSGAVTVDGTNVLDHDLVRLRRSMGYVFQDIGLFPHLSIRQNIELVPRLLGWPAERRRRRADELLELVGLDPDDFSERYPDELSGGQQQRVGVARALAARPYLLLLDEVLAEQEGDFDPDSRWALAWFEQSGFGEGDYGVAEVLSKAKDTSIAGMMESGLLVSKKGKVRLLRPKELPADWDPAADKRLTVWEMVHHLVRVLESDGEGKAAELAAKLGAGAETARELCYRLYTICERKKRAAEALSYNALVQSWPEITRLARKGVKYEAKPRELEF